MIKRIFLYMALMMSFAACSDDIFDAPRETVPENGEIPVAFTVPDMQTAQTRGVEENEIGKVYMLAYDKKDGSLAFTDELKVDENNKATITIDPDYRDYGSLYFLFFVNDSRTDATFKNNSDKNMSVATSAENTYLTVSGGSGSDDRMTMSGAASLSSLLQLTPIALHRNAAKVTVVSYEDDKVTFEYEVYGTAKSSKLMAGASNAGTDSPYSDVTNYCSEPEKVTEFVSFGTDYKHNFGQTVYLHPTYNTGGTSLNASYIMVRAKSTEDQQYYYYRLNFQKEDEGVLDILPNHYYEVKIKTGNIGKGYTTQEEAAENPVPLESGSYVIYDHSPQVFNIVTDGVRALGVSDKVATSGSNYTENAYLYVKLFSSTGSAEDEYDEFFDNYTNYIKFADDSWISLNGIEKASGSDVGSAGDNNVTVKNIEYKDGGNGGQYEVYKVTCCLTKSGAGSQATTGTVTWKGLSRKFDVEWDRSFKASDLYSSVEVSFSGNSYGSNPSIARNNYFEWLGGELNDDGTYLSNPKVWGADKKSNNGEARDQGFHFPVKGGGTVTYTVELNDLGGGSDYKWSYSYEGDNVGCTLKVNNAALAQNTQQSMAANAKPTFTLSGGNDNFNYGVANLVIRIETTSARDVQYYRIPLYHTGFFMDASESSGENSKYKATGIGLAKKLDAGRDYTYYEVVAIKRDNRTYHILDRNLGAHSAEMYVEATGDVAYAGNPEAAGGYYRVANYWKENKPIIKNSNVNGNNVDNYPKIGAPSGFEIPQEEVFDDIRNSSDFSMAAVGSYYTAVYAGEYYGPADEDGNRSRKYIYFPKARYLDSNNSKVGDSRAGYYWTSTAASGLEKEDVGAWLDCLQLTGSASGYIRGEVYCPSSNIAGSNTSTYGNSVRTGEINGYAMPVRLVLGEENSAGSTVYQTRFFVKGATHVYLYTVDEKGNRTALTSWPGYAICTASTATNIYNFLYESKINQTQDLYAIFNYKSSSGAIFSMSYNASDIKKGKFTNTTNPKDLVGFNLAGVNQTRYEYQNGLAPDFTTEEIYGTATKSVENGVTWGFSFDTSNNYATASMGGIGLGTALPKNYRIYFPQSGTSEFYMWYVDNGNQHFFPSGGNYSNNKEGTYYYLDFTDEGKSTTANLIYSRGDGHKDKSLGKALQDFDRGDDGKYYAYIDGSDVFHPGKPGGGTGSDKYTIYYTNPSGWSNVNVYVKNGNGTYSGYSNWPGNPMTKDGSNWTFEIPKDATTIVFNNGNSGNGNQTADVPVVKDDNHTYTDNAQESSDNRYGDFANGTTFSIHSSMTNTNWETVEMKDDDKDGVWEVTIKATQTNWSFGIKTSDSSKDWLNGENSTVSYGSAMKVKTGGSNWSGSGKGTYTFKFSPSKMTLIVEASGVDDFDGVTITGDYNVAVDASDNYNYIHYWGNDNDKTNWPGKTMTEVKGSDNKDYYVYKVPEGTTSVIFHNNSGNQTSDLTYSNEYIYNAQGVTTTKVRFVSSSSRRRPAAKAGSAKTTKSVTAATTALRK